MFVAARARFAVAALLVAITGCWEPLEATPTESSPPSRAEPRAPARKRAELAPPATSQQIYYQYVDERGAVRFAASLDEVPADKRAGAGKLVIDAPRPQAAAPPPTARRPEPRERPSADAATESLARNDVEVVLYTTTWCGYCKRAIAYLDRIGQDYENKDIEASKEAASEHRAYSDRGGVPTIRVGDQVMQGWDERSFRELLANAN